MREGGLAVEPFGIVTSTDQELSGHIDANPTAAARRFFERAIGTTRVTPIEVTTDRAVASDRPVRQQPH